MKKFNLLVLLLPLVALPACDKTQDYYQITFHTRTGDIVKYCRAGRNIYPTIEGWKYGSQLTEDEALRYTPSLSPVTKDAVYSYKDCKVTIEDVPEQGQVIKYFAYGETISFNDFGMEYQRYSDNPVTAFYDQTFYYRYKATFSNVRDPDGSSVDESSTYFSGGSSFNYNGGGNNYYSDHFYDRSFRYWTIYNKNNTFLTYYYPENESIFDSIQLSFYEDLLLSAQYN